MAYSNRELGDLGAMRKRNRIGDLIGWLNKATENEVANLETAQKKAGIHSNATLHSYTVSILKDEDEVQEAYELSPHGLQMAQILEQWSGFAAKQNARFSSEQSKLRKKANEERGFY